MLQRCDRNRTISHETIIVIIMQNENPLHCYCIFTNVYTHFAKQVSTTPNQLVNSYTRQTQNYTHIQLVYKMVSFRWVTDSVCVIRSSHIIPLHLILDSGSALYSVCVQWAWVWVCVCLWKSLYPVCIEYH